jgi:HSP20 family protein
MLSRHFGGDGGEEALVGAYPVDIREDDNNVYVDAELPGFKREQVDVTIENGILTIQAERQPDEQQGDSHLRERRYTRVARSFTLPNGVDENSVDAKLDDGVLKLTLQKSEQVKPRKIEVK